MVVSSEECSLHWCLIEAGRKASGGIHAGFIGVATRLQNLKTEDERIGCFLKESEKKFFSSSFWLSLMLMLFVLNHYSNCCC